MNGFPTPVVERDIYYPKLKDNNIFLYDLAVDRLLSEPRSMYGHYMSESNTYISLTVGALNVWRWKETEILPYLDLRIKIPFQEFRNKVVILYCYKNLVGVGSGSNIIIWDINTGQMKNFLALKKDMNLITSLCFDNEVVVCGGWNGSLDIWNAETSEKMVTLILKSTTPAKKLTINCVLLVHSCYFTDGDIRVLTGTEGGDVSCFNITKRKYHQRFSGHRVGLSNAVYDLQWCHGDTGRYFFTATIGGEIKIWDITSTSKEEHETFSCGIHDRHNRKESVRCVGTWLIAPAYPVHSVKIWNVLSGRELKNIPGYCRWFDFRKEKLIALMGSSIQYWEFMTLHDFSLQL